MQALMPYLITLQGLKETGMTRHRLGILKALSLCWSPVTFCGRDRPSQGMRLKFCANTGRLMAHLTHILNVSRDKWAISLLGDERRSAGIIW
ncbi:hypothetical protein CEXT_10211 [Caerostris extrusa]|uniref:Uncharacterized protein n=1 Tax=Caerostris extrusa TaxID=172846 RepID=A0AAV4WN20_CAEEX|nr:hypothetical protein CEXT_10211 [Caerostris extrusa]